MRSVLTVLLSTPLLLSCVIQQPETVQPETTVSPSLTMVDTSQGTLPNTLQTQVLTDLANHLDIPTDQIDIKNYGRQTWSDGCLGLGGPAENCLAALTDGWQVEAIDTETNETYVYRTDLNGAQIRREP
ncbi:MAG: hypothetical protein AAF243_07205 [Cyanobacteria bacterium P01_A01_bin.137]